MKKRTTVSKPRQKISLRLSKSSPKRTIARRQRREGRKVASVVIFSGILFIVTFVFLYLINPFYHSGLTSPMPLQKEVKGLLVRQDSDLAKLKKLLSEHHIAYATISEGQGNSFIITLVTKEEILLASDQDLLRQVSSLQVILTRLTMEDKRVRRLDLRFDKPVITYK